MAFRKQKVLFNCSIISDKPVYDDNIEKTITGIEDEPLIINMKAEGNPGNIGYTWTKDGLPITQVGSSTGTERIISEGSILNITKLSRHDVGSYSCEALNAQGSTVAVVNITVQCKIKSYFSYIITYSLKFNIFQILPQL